MSYIHKFRGRCDVHGWIDTPGYSLVPPPFCPVDGVHSYYNVIIHDTKKVVTGGVDYNNYMNTNFTEYTATGYLRWPGSIAIGVPLNIEILANIDSGATGSITLYDITNHLNICEYTNIHGVTPTIYNVGTISNISTAASIWEIQIKCSSIATLEIWNVNIK